MISSSSRSTSSKFSNSFTSSISSNTNNNFNTSSKLVVNYFYWKIIFILSRENL